jgi:hypothetical protein
MMVEFKTTLHKFDQQGEKTGWTYVELSKGLAEKLNPGVRKSYRVKGFIDAHDIKLVALIPMGEGSFIIPVNNKMRKAIGKKEGDPVVIQIELDRDEYKISDELLICLSEDLEACFYFDSLPKSHRNYYSKWVDSAKTENTRADRIMKVLFAMQHKMDYGAMIRHFRDK